MLVRFLYWVVLALLLRLVFRGLARRQASFSPRGEADPTTIYKGFMVRDPVCGLHIPESRALVETHAGEKVHFCSNDCRVAYRNSAS